MLYTRTRTDSSRRSVFVQFHHLYRMLLLWRWANLHSLLAAVKVGPSTLCHSFASFNKKDFHIKTNLRMMMLFSILRKGKATVGLQEQKGTMQPFILRTMSDCECIGVVRARRAPVLYCTSDPSSHITIHHQSPSSIIASHHHPSSLIVTHYHPS